MGGRWLCLLIRAKELHVRFDEAYAMMGRTL